MDDREERKALREANRQERLKAELRRQYLAASMSCREGREFFWWLLSMTNYRSTPFTTNALSTSFNCGQQNIGIMIETALIEAAHEGFLTMIKEKNDARSSPDTGTEPDADPDT